MRQDLRRVILIFCIVLPTGLCCLERTAAAQRDTGTVWVDMTSAPPTFEFQQFSDALALRLPNRRIAPKPEGAVLCPENGPNDAVVQFKTVQDKSVLLTVISCKEETLQLQAPLRKGTDDTETIRNAALSTVLALDADKASPPEKPTTNKIDAALQARTRTQGVVSLAPGATVTFGGNGAFTGFVDAGVLFTNHLALTAGVDFSSRIRGTAAKKNETPAEGTEVGVTDFAFRIGLYYQFSLSARWFLETGAGARYIHAKVQELTSNKFAVEEPNPAARGSVFITLNIGIHLTGILAMCLRVMPAVSFGRRQYVVRGEEALNFGWGTVGISLGPLVYF